MILSTTPQIEGHTIREYKGIVTGETIIGANMFKDLFAGIRDIVGGRAGAYEKVLAEAKDTSVQEMMQRERLDAHGSNKWNSSSYLKNEKVCILYHAAFCGSLCCGSARSKSYRPLYEVSVFQPRTPGTHLYP